MGLSQERLFFCGAGGICGADALAREEMCSSHVGTAALGCPAELSFIIHTNSQLQCRVSDNCSRLRGISTIA